MNIKREKKVKNSLCGCNDCSNSNTYFDNLRQIGEDLKLDQKLNLLSMFLHALGNRERLTILTTLKERERCVCELEAILDKSQPSISHHLRELEKLGLIRGWKKREIYILYIIKKGIQKLSR